jgi:hypothetical protein
VVRAPRTSWFWHQISIDPYLVLVKGMPLLLTLIYGKTLKMFLSQKNVELTRPFLEEEIKHALFEMERNKAVGPDGLPIEFYQSY